MPSHILWGRLLPFFHPLLFWWLGSGTSESYPVQVKECIQTICSSEWDLPPQHIANYSFVGHTCWSIWENCKTTNISTYELCRLLLSFSMYPSSWLVQPLNPRGLKNECTWMDSCAWISTNQHGWIVWEMIERSKPYAPLNLSWQIHLTYCFFHEYETTYMVVHISPYMIELILMKRHLWNNNLCYSKNGKC